MANMNLRESWEDESQMVSYLANQLTLGRLSIVLGAGVSEFYGLPSWTVLINRLSKELGEPDMVLGANPLIRAEKIKSTHFPNDETGFAGAVKRALYEGVSNDFQVIRKNDLLSAIGALAMSSGRGSASTVITFNYDDILESFLEYHGYVTAVINNGKHWTPKRDVAIYHPHGFLPLDESRKTTPSNIVLATSDYLDIMDNSSKNLWRPVLQTIFRSHTFLYIGLSGSDLHLQSLVHDLKENHAITDDRVRYHGVRFTERRSVDEDILGQYDGWGVYTHKLNDFRTDLPSILFSICQAARAKRSGEA